MNMNHLRVLIVAEHASLKYGGEAGVTVTLFSSLTKTRY